jgi:methionyl aminopeptidase
VANTPGADPALLHAGLVITIEPRPGRRRPGHPGGEDGWTILTADGAPAAHVEHTIGVTNRAPLVLTR